MSDSVPFGPGTVTITLGPEPGVGQPFECEVTGGAVTHSYEEVDQSTRLCDTGKRGPRKVRGPDGLNLSLANDLSESGLYAFTQANDLADAYAEFMPNTAAGASWSGPIVLTLPEEIGAGEWGSDIASEVSFASPGTFVFVPAGMADTLDGPDVWGGPDDADDEDVIDAEVLDDDQAAEDLVGAGTGEVR